MDRSWILRPDRRSKEFVEGIESFLKVASTQVNEKNECLCPCRRCLNRCVVKLSGIKSHILRNRFTSSYDVWVCHSEKEHGTSSFTARNVNTTTAPNDLSAAAENTEASDTEDDFVMRTLLEDLGRGIENNGLEQPLIDSDQYRFFGENGEKLYPGCKFSVLEVVIRMMHIKVINRWTDKSFDLNLKLIKLVWPALNKFPTSTYEAKKMLRDVGLGYVKIDACKNDCCLFWKETAENDRCYICGESRYKDSGSQGKSIPHKSLRYIPPVKRLQRLFGSRHTAEDMRWHKDKRVKNSDVLTHPADGEAWTDFDETYPQFSDEARNVRLGLAADGFCPFDASYSMWPVILVPYNLPPWKCMQQQFHMLTLLIPGPTSPGKDIDVYLRPLIDDLKNLWSVGVETFDAASNAMFQMKACLLWTINDFPAYGILSGWSTHGKKSCPVCLDDTSSHSITSKLCFMAARRFLDIEHPWRRSRLHDGSFELRDAPEIKSGEQILAALERLPNITFGKHAQNKDHKRKRTPEEQNWTKKSIFYELPYWRNLKLPHNLDVMHIEKNVNDNVLYTLINTDGRTKDTNKARIDLERFNIRKDLHLKTLTGGKVVKPAAPYVLNSADRTKFLQFIKSVKYPDGYAANLSRCVNVKEGKISGLKTHDCHVLFQRLMPIAIRGLLPKEVCNVLIEFSVFFQRLTSKSLHKSELDELQKSIVMVLCKLERIFPPAFFDVMIHLSVHLVREVRLGGPVNFRWMYPFERDMGVYKKYVRNRANPEGSIVEAYSINEALSFCGMYFDDSENQFARHERNNDTVFSYGTTSVFSQRAKPFGGISIEIWSKLDIEKIHWAILNNCENLSAFRNAHMSKLAIESPDTFIERHREEFPSWFEQRILQLRREGSPLATDELYALSKQPNPCCIVNGVRFRVKDRDEKKITQNSGISIFAEHDDDIIDYYGHLTKVIVLDYILDYKVVVFQCEWFDTNPKKNMVKQNYHFKSVNTRTRWYVDDPYILATQAKQVFYVDDTRLGGDWKIVQEVEQRNVWDIPEEEDTVQTSDAYCEAYQRSESVQNELAADPNDDLEHPYVWDINYEVDDDQYVDDDDDDDDDNDS